MAFVNVQVDLADLPQADELVMEPMAPSYEREVKTQQFIIWVPIVLLSFLPVLLTQFLWLLAIPMSVLILAGIISRLSRRMKREPSSGNMPAKQ